jgi:hypothetical protein
MMDQTTDAHQHNQHLAEWAVEKLEDGLGRVNAMFMKPAHECRRHQRGEDKHRRKSPPRYRHIFFNHRSIL